MLNGSRAMFVLGRSRATTRKAMTIRASPAPKAT